MTPALQHPRWCDQKACTAADLGLHQSAPLPANPDGDELFGVAVRLVLFARFDESHTLFVFDVTSDGETVEYLLGRRQTVQLRRRLGEALLAAAGIGGAR